MTEHNPYQAPLSAFDEMPRRELPPPGVHHTPEMMEALRATRPWVLFLGILGFVGAGFMVLGGLFFLFAMLAAATGGGSSATGVGQAVLVAAMYVFFGGVYALFAWLLIRYSGAIGRFLATDATEHLEQALDSQRVFWKVSGIVAIVSMVLSFLAVIAVAVVGAVAAVSSMPGF